MNRAFTLLGEKNNLIPKNAVQNIPLCNLQTAEELNSKCGYSIEQITLQDTSLITRSCSPPLPPVMTDVPL